MFSICLLFALISGAIAGGQKDSGKHARIVGGVLANTSQYPFLLRLDIRVSGSGYRCGGSLIGDSWILTAAHCVSDDNGVAMSTSTTTMMAEWGADNPTNQLAIDYWRLHPAYDSVAITDDIALLHLASPAPDNPLLKPIKFFPTALADNTIVRAVGWGETAPGVLADNCYEVDVHTTSATACDVIREDYQNLPTLKTVCAGGSPQDEGKDACGGDSGGPLIMRANASSPWYQVGVVSYGYGPAAPADAKCGDNDYWGVYGSPYHYVDWIESVTENSSALSTVLHPATLFLIFALF